MAHILPQLPYAYDALLDAIDAQTMEIHHTKHHQAYIDKLNAALAGTGLEDAALEKLFANDCAFAPENIRTAVRNHGGGHYNHSLFWKIMAPAGQKGTLEENSELADAIKSSFGSPENFKSEFVQAAATQFGSGWAWLSLDSNGKLVVSATPNQENPLMKGMKPILGIDVWEHAYYLKYQNRRPDYIEAWYGIVNWNQVAEYYSTYHAM